MRLEPSSNTSQRSFTHLDKQVSLKQAMFYQCWVSLHFIRQEWVRNHGWATSRVSLPKSARVIVFKHYKDPKTSLNSLPEWFFPKMWCTSPYILSRPLHHSERSRTKRRSCNLKMKAGAKFRTTQLTEALKDHWSQLPTHTGLIIQYQLKLWEPSLNRSHLHSCLCSIFQQVNRNVQPNSVSCMFRF